MSLAVVGERALWLGLSGLSEREFLDVPVELKALFGAAVTNMHQQCNLCKKDGEAFKKLPPQEAKCLTPTPPTHASWIFLCFQTGTVSVQKP